MTTTTSGSAWTYEVKGSVRLADGSPATGLSVSAADRDLRSEQPLGQAITGQDGAYYLQYDAAAYAGEESVSADLVVKAHGADGSVLAASPVLFNAPPSAVVDLTIPAEALQPPSRFEVIGRALQPLLDGVTILRLEEDAKNQDVSFLAGETGLDKSLLARFILAHRLPKRICRRSSGSGCLAARSTSGPTARRSPSNSRPYHGHLPCSMSRRCARRSPGGSPPMRSPRPSSSASRPGSKRSPRSSRVRLSARRRPPASCNRPRSCRRPRRCQARGGRAGAAPGARAQREGDRRPRTKVIGRECGIGPKSRLPALSRPGRPGSVWPIQSGRLVEPVQRHIATRRLRTGRCGAAEVYGQPVGEVNGERYRIS
jgi:hypothetical protein